jgi:formate C-acetyltransferase
MEQNGFSISPGRFDQYMYPLYRKDIDEGRITDDEVLELIENLWVNCMSITIGGIMISMTQTVMLCGKDLDGKDMTNELSFLCIKADRDTCMVQPSLMVRWHANIDRRIMEEVAEATYTHEASIAIINDEAIIPSLMKLGIKKEDAYNYVQVGCNETELPGKMMGGGLPRPVFMLRLIDLAMCGGKWRPTGEQLGPVTKQMGEYDSFDDFVGAYRTQLNHFVRYTSLAVNLMDQLHAVYRPLIFASSLMSGTIDRGRDIQTELDYFFYAAGGNDFVPAVNSFSAIKKAVFEDKTVSQEELQEAIDANYEGHENTRLKLWNSPKFGNDDDSVDDLMFLVSELGRKAFEPFRSFRNNSPWIWECIPRISHVYEGLRMWATPDGRKQGTSLAAGISGQSGTEMAGPTAFLNSVSKLNFDQFVGGVVTNLRLNPNMLENGRNRQKTIDMLNAYFRRGGQHLQLNAVDRETLLDAQKHPEKYRDLMVRVAGYVDYFLNLDEASQDDIIRRTIHEAS